MDVQLKLPPHHVESEQSVLGGLLLDPSAFDKIAGMISADDFFSRDHKLIFNAESAILNAGKPLDLVTLAEHLEAIGKLNDVGGLMYLGQLAQNTPGAANIERYAEIVRDKSLKRQMIQAADGISTQVYQDAGKDAKTLLDDAQSKFMRIGEHVAGAAETTHHVGKVVDAVLEHIDGLAVNGMQDDVTGLRTGLSDLDKLTTGLQPGELIILAARPSMGKTSLALNFIEHAAISSKKNVVFFSLEMINQQLGVRLLSSVAQVNQQRVKVGRMNDAEWANVVDAAEKLRKTGIYLDEQSRIGVNDIKSRARKIHRESDGVGLIVVDYLQLMRLGDDFNKADAIGEVTGQLKDLGKELHCPVLCLSQLNRSLEQRPDKRPVMSDLRDSGAIEQDADLILFIYRDEVYNPDSPDRGIAELIVAKQRNGPIGKVHCTFIPHLMRFANFAGEVPSVEAYKAKRAQRMGNSRGNFRDKNDDDGVDF